MHFSHLRHYAEHYFAPHPSQEVRELFWSSAIRRFAMSLIVVFEPIYLYSLGYTIAQILLFYGAMYVIYFFVLPLGGRICRSHGFEHTMLWSAPFLIIYYLSLFAIQYNRVYIVAALLAAVIYKVLYWPGYHSNFATWGDGRESGREISNMYAMMAFVSALGPFFGALIISAGEYVALFVTVSVLVLFSNLPMLRTPEIFQPKKFSYFGSFQRLVAPKNRRLLVTMFGFGEEIYALILWPIFIVVVLGDTLKVGALVSLSMIATVLVTLYVGRLVDDGERVQVLRSGSFFVAGSWLSRLVVSGGLGIFLTDAFYRVAKNMVIVPVLAVVYDNARRKSTTERVVLFEMALSLGKAVAALVAAMLFYLLSTFWATIFVLAAFFTLCYAMVREPVEEVAE